MKMLVAALIGGVVVGFVAAQVLMPEVAKMVADPYSQNMATLCLTAFLGALWGWVGKGVMGAKEEK